MPLRHTDKGWFWGSKGPFPSKDKALAVARAAYAGGYKEESEMELDLIKVAEFIATLRNSSTITHFMHLQVVGEGSLARHEALGEYYEAIVPLVDSVAEQIQGAYDVIIAPYPPAFGNVDMEAFEYAKSLRAYVRNVRASLPQDSEIQNEVDEIAKLINKTCYKLNRLR